MNKKLIGWQPTLSNEEYFADPRISASDLKLALKGALNFQNTKKFPYDSSALKFGSAFHEAALLEQQKTKLTPAYQKHCDAMLSQLSKVSFFQDLLKEPSRAIETPGFTETQKVKPDLRIPDIGLIIDLKTCGDASPEKFKWDAKKFLYHLQAKHYLDVCSELDQTEYRHFIFIACEKTAPYNIFLHTLSESVLSKASALKEEALELLTKFKTDLDNEVKKEQNEIHELDF